MTLNARLEKLINKISFKIIFQYKIVIMFFVKTVCVFNKKYINLISEYIF